MSRLFRGAGMVVQAVMLGVLLFLAVGGLVALESGARVFRYQAF